MRYASVPWRILEQEQGAWIQTVHGSWAKQQKTGSGLTIHTVQSCANGQGRAHSNVTQIYSSNYFDSHVSVSDGGNLRCMAAGFCRINQGLQSLTSQVFAHHAKNSNIPSHSSRGRNSYKFK